MKKLIAVLTLLLAFTVGANAQDKKVSNEEAAQKDVAALVQKVTISESLKKDMQTLMVMKHEALSNPSNTAADKENISKRFERKVLAGLTEAQRAVVIADAALLKQISH